MTLKNRLIGDRKTFAADTDDVQIVQPRYIKNLNFALLAAEVGAVAVTLPELLSLLASVQIKEGGTIITEMSATDILAYNILKEGNEPIYLLPAADTQKALIYGLDIPIHRSPTSEVLAYRGGFLANAKIGSATLSVMTQEYDGEIEPGRIAIPRFNFTPPSTGAYNIAVDSTFDGDVIGLLLMSTTIPTAISLTTSLAKIRLTVEGVITNELRWENLNNTNKYPGDSTLRGIIDNYAYLNMEEEPIPKGSRIEIGVFSDDTQPIRILPVIRKTG